MRASRTELLPQRRAKPVLGRRLAYPITTVAPCEYNNAIQPSLVRERPVARFRDLPVYTDLYRLLPVTTVAIPGDAASGCTNRPSGEVP